MDSTTNDSSPSPHDGQRALRAVDVLPAELVRALQAHVTGVYLYVPAPSSEARKARDAEVMRLRAAGRSIAQVATDMGLTVRRVLQIQKRERERAGVQQ